MGQKAGRCRSLVIEVDPKDFYRLGYVPEALAAQSATRNFYFALDLLQHWPGYANPAAFGNCLKPGCNIDAVSV